MIYIIVRSIKRMSNVLPPFDFDVVNLIPRMGVVKSRGECDTSITINGIDFRNPVILSNMETVINEDLAVKLATAGYFYIMHRFDAGDILDFCRRMRRRGLYVSISVGVTSNFMMLLESIKRSDVIPDFITIDIAHGHCEQMRDMITFIRSIFASSSGLQAPFIIAGNVSTPEAVRDLESWGADGIKIGIGPGMACTTYDCTGFGSRGMQAWTIQQCAAGKRVDDTVIIADGGVRSPGDLVKSIVMGADMVMVGSMFASCRDSPAKIGGDGTKEYYGSASSKQSGKVNRVEGRSVTLDMKDRMVLDEMKYVEECLQSAISYAGGRRLNDLFSVEFIVRNK